MEQKNQLKSTEILITMKQYDIPVPRWNGWPCLNVQWTALVGIMKGSSIKNQLKQFSGLFHEIFDRIISFLTPKHISISRVLCLHVQSDKLVFIWFI